MVSALSWGPPVPVEATLGLDPVSVWLKGEGRDFATHLLSEAGAAGLDFRYVAAIDAEDPVAHLRPGRPGTSARSLVAILNEDLDTDEGLMVEDLRSSLFCTRLGMRKPRLFLLPLRADSVLTPDAQETLRQIEPTRSLPAATRGKPPRGARRRPVVGIIDHGINIAHERFRFGPGATRVAFAWDQGGRYDDRGAVPFGRAFQAHEIDDVLQRCHGDETEVLRQLDLVDFTRPGARPLAAAHSHGTHVLDLAAGADPGAAADAPIIIAVNLPPVVAREPSGTFLGMFFIQGVEYILNCARSLPDVGPLYLNFSFALSGGPRRGRHILERSLAGLIELNAELGGPDVTVVMPAGNRNVAGGHLVRHMARAGDRAAITWQLQPGDATSNILEIWLSAPAAGLGFDPDIRLEITPPGGAPIEAVFDAGAAAARTLRMGGQVIGRVTREAPLRGVVADDGSVVLTVILAATDPGLSGRIPAPPGPWALRVSTEAACEVTLEAWVLRDDTIAGFTDNGRQSYILDPAQDLRDARGLPLAEDPPAASDGLRRAGTLNALTTSDAPWLVTVGAATGAGGTTRTDPSAALYSGTPLPEDSPLNLDERVDVSAIAERSPVRGGVLAAGTLSGSCKAMGGTSAAAPQVVRGLIARAEALTQGPRRHPRLGASVLPAPPDVRGKSGR